MAIPLITATVRFKDATYKLTENYLPYISVDEYIKKFEQDVPFHDSSTGARVVLLEVTRHLDNGDFKLDEFGGRVFRTIYKSV